MNEAHKFKRRVLQWAFPDALSEMTEMWDGREDYQRFLDRAAKWNGIPVSAIQITAKEADYHAHRKRVDGFAEIERGMTATETAPVVARKVEDLLTERILAGAVFDPAVKRWINDRRAVRKQEPLP